MSTPSTQHRWPWWHRQTPTTRKSLRGLLALLVTGLIALAVGVATASAESSLGPHEADYHMTLDREVTLDLGPLGAIILDSPLPWPLGVEVVVHEIPAEVLDEGESPLPGLASDLAAYGQLISVPDAAVADAVDGLVDDAVGRAVVLWSMMLLAIAAGRLASGGRLRVEVKAALARPGVGVLVGAVALAAVATPVVPAMRQQEADGQQLRLLHGTPLEGARITGRLAGLIDTYGGVVVGAYRDNEAFYAQVTDNLAAAYEQDEEPLEPSTDAMASPTPADLSATPSAAPEDAGDASGGTGAGAGDGGGTTGSPIAPEDGSAPGPTAPDATVPPPAGGIPQQGAEAAGTDGVVRSAEEEATEPEPVTFLLVSDLHCNVGMADVVGEVARLAEVDAVLDAGDTVMSGTSVESFCVNAFAAAVPDGLPWVVATGNHDSVHTAEQARAAGWTVLDGDVVDVAGVRVLGATDPTLTAIGQGTVQEREETIPELGTRLADTACEAAETDPVDVLLIHNPRAGEATMERGCAPLQLSGHWHRRVGPEPTGEGVRLISTSTGGGAEGGTTMGPLRSAAELTVLRVDAATGTPMDYRTIEVHPDTTVTLGEWFAFPQPEVEEEPSVAPPVGPGPGVPGTEVPDGPGLLPGAGEDSAPAGGTDDDLAPPDLAPPDEDVEGTDDDVAPPDENEPGSGDPAQ